MSDESINPVAQHDPDDSAKFLVEAYKECFREKRHYDILSWTLLAGIGLLSRPLFEAIIAVEGSGQLEIALRMGLSLGVCFILFIYWRIYERNRFWGEVCNETARQIERRMKLEGPSIACMKGALKRQIVLQNTDENASPVADIRIEVSPRSMHLGIRALLLFVGLASIALGIADAGLLDTTQPPKLDNNSQTHSSSGVSSATSTPGPRTQSPPP